jgi:PAS domain S-box-containing protein
MSIPNWYSEFNGAVTVCDIEGTIIEMNQKAIDGFHKYGGEELIGKSLLDCHPESAREKLVNLMHHQETNVYTIEKNGVKKLIYQSPWFVDGEFKGFVELSIEIPENMPHFIRK